jgi:hypothetical protein
VRIHVDVERDGVIACNAAGKFGIERRDEKPRRREPGILWIARSPLVERIFRKKQQMFRLFGQEPMRLVPLLELHRFIANAQRAHLELAEVFVGRRARDRKLGE